MANYDVKYQKGSYVEISSVLNNYKFYRVPYSLLESKKHGIVTDCNFIVYLLIGKDSKDGRDSLYVGTSTDGIDGRPTSHEKKESVWSDCIIFTGANDKLLNNSRILYLEDRLRHLIDDTKRYKNETIVTTGKAANKDEKALCESILPSILEVYYILGVDLTPKYKTDLRDYVEKKTEQKEDYPIVATDYSSLKLPSEMEDWLKAAESAVIGLDPKLKANVTSQYASYKYDKVSKTVAYCYPNRREKTIRVLFQGTPDWYNDKRVTDRPENMHNGDCKAMFFIKCADDLKYFRLFAEIAIQKLRKSS